MFISEIKIDFENNANNITLYTCDLQLEKVIETLGKKKAEKLFQWFYNNFLKTNFVKCHFLINNLEKMAINIRLDKVLGSSSRKLLGIFINPKLSFHDHVKILCCEAPQKLYVLSRVVYYIDISQHKSNDEGFHVFPIWILSISTGVPQQKVKQSYKYL